jgi:hypothetical protein
VRKNTNIWRLKTSRQFRFALKDFPSWRRCRGAVHFHALRYSRSRAQAVTTTIILAVWIFLSAVFAIAVGTMSSFGTGKDEKPDPEA